VFVLPGRDPNFPGRAGLRWYLPLTVAFFAAMMAAVLVFGREKKEAKAEAAAPTTTATAPGSRPAGNPTAGKAVFTKAGCVACHTFTPAGSTGKVGPDLDKLADYAAKAKQPVSQFAESAITHPPPVYVPPGYPTNVMPTNFGTTLSSTEITDLVAFLTGSATGSAAPPATSTSAATTTSSGEAPPTGDAAAGATVFKTAGCVACHTLKAAGSTGTVGPNLDEKKPPAALILQRVENGKGAMPSFKSSLSEKQIEDVVAYVYKSTHP
jgi:mono/diheme cytochrome c family protein